MKNELDFLNLQTLGLILRGAECPKILLPAVRGEVALHITTAPQCLQEQTNESFA